jgi:protein O-GlcNAc transferase
MGFCGTLGAEYVQYLVADPWVIPPEARPFYSEKLLLMPHSYFVNDHRQSARHVLTGPLPSRASYGVPEDKFVFCNFNQTYKIDPSIADTWARILQRVPNALLWLLRFPPAGEANLRAELERRGVGAHQLHFTAVAPKDEHLRRGVLADLFLDTPCCNAHTTGCDILWAGTPMLTLPGDKMATRVGSSLLQAAQLPELVATSRAHYEDLAVELAMHPEKLFALRQRLENSRDQCPLFDTKRSVHPPTPDEGTHRRGRRDTLIPALPASKAVA